MRETLNVLPNYLIGKLKKYEVASTTAGMEVAVAIRADGQATKCLAGIYGEVNFCLTSDVDGQVELSLSTAKGKVTNRQARMFFTYLKLNPRSFPAAHTFATGTRFHVLRTAV